MAMFFVLFSTLHCARRTSEMLLRFLNLVILALGVSFAFPKTQVTMYKRYGIDSVINGGMKLYAVCPNKDCNFVYIENAPQRCTNMLNENHATYLPTRCHTRLYNVDAYSNSSSSYAKKVYPYQSIQESLAVLFQRPGFVDKINHWRNRNQVPGVLSDVYDGQMWNELRDIDGNQFNSDHYSLLLTLNVDWFQAFDKTGAVHSTGAMYITINNLPRSERYTYFYKKKTNKRLIIFLYFLYVPDSELKMFCWWV